jgi:hypothetical protein
MPDEAFGPPTLNGPSVPPYWYWLTQESDLARERDLFDRDAMTAARSFSTTDQSNVAVSPPAPNAVPLIRDGHGFATDVVLASRSLVAAPAPVTSDHEGRAVTPKVRSEERPVPMASSTAPGLPPSSESSGGGVSGIDPVARPKSNGDSARHGDSLDSPGEGPREVPPPHGAGLIAELLPFDRATLERAVDRFLNAFEDLGVPGMVEAAQSPPPLMLAIMFAALEVARRRLRQSDKTARSGRLAPGLVRGRFPELLGTSSVKRP